MKFLKLLLMILTLIVAIATLDFMVNDSKHTKEFYRMVEEHIKGKQPHDDTEVGITPIEPPPEIRFEEPHIKRKASVSGNTLVKALQEIAFADDQVDYIRKNRDSIPKGLKLSIVTKALQEIAFGDNQVEALKLLGDKIDRNYTDTEFEEFIKVFSFSDDKVEAASILHGK